MLHNLPSLFPWKHNKTKIMAEPVLEDINLEEQLEPCGICGRTFLPAPLAKHSKVCEKNATKKRKVFNSLKQRVEGTDLAVFHQRSYLKTPAHTQPAPVAAPAPAADPQKKSSPKHAWKEKHQQLVNAIRAAKSAPLINKRTAVTASCVGERCPSCDRQFGPKAFDRHVEWCKERRARLPQSPANIQQAKERLEARIKYRVPPMNKPKKTVKEKYQSPYRNENLPVVRSTGNLDRKPSIRRSSVNLRKSPENSPKPSPKPKVVKSETKKVEPIVKSKQVATLKLNSMLVNCLTSGLTVSHLTGPGLPPKKLVTWRDTYPCNPKIMPVVKKEEEGSSKDESINEDGGNTGSIWNNASCLLVEERPKEVARPSRKDLGVSRRKSEKNVCDLTEGIPLTGFVLKQNEDKEFCLSQLGGQKIVILLSPADQRVLGGFPEKVKDNFMILVPKYQVADVRKADSKKKLDFDEISSSPKLVSDSFTLAECDSLPKSELANDNSFPFISHANSCDSLNTKIDYCEDLVLSPQDMKVNFNERYAMSNREAEVVADLEDEQIVDEPVYQEEWQLDEDFDERNLMCAGDFVPEKLKIHELFETNLKIDDRKHLVYQFQNASPKDHAESPREIVPVKDTFLQNTADYSKLTINDLDEDIDQRVKMNKLENKTCWSDVEDCDKDLEIKSRIQELGPNVSSTPKESTSSNVLNELVEIENVAEVDSNEYRDSKSFAEVEIIVDGNENEELFEVEAKNEEHINTIPVDEQDEQIFLDKNQEKIFHKCIEFKENDENSLERRYAKSEDCISKRNTEYARGITKSLSSLSVEEISKIGSLKQESAFGEPTRRSIQTLEIPTKHPKYSESSNDVEAETAEKEKLQFEESNESKLDTQEKSIADSTQNYEDSDSLNESDLTNKNIPVRDGKYYPTDVLPSVESSVFSFGCEKINFSNSHVICDKTWNTGDEESFGGLYDDHSVALSRARIERTIRSCCSEINLSAESQGCFMNTSCSDSNIPNRVIFDDDFVPVIKKKGRKIASTPRRKICKEILEEKRKIKSGTDIKRNEDVFEPVESKRIKLDDDSCEDRTKSSLLCCALDKVLNENLEKTRTSRVLKLTKSDCDRLLKLTSVSTAKDKLDESNEQDSQSELDAEQEYLRNEQNEMDEYNENKCNEEFEEDEFNCEEEERDEVKKEEELDDKKKFFGNLNPENEEKKDDCGLKLPPIFVQLEEKPEKEIVEERLVLPKIGSKPSVCVQYEDARSESYNPIVAAERQLLELLDCDDFKPFKPSNHPTPSQKQSPAKSRHSRASVIDPPSDFEDSVDFELIENFINDNLNDHELLAKLDLDAISIKTHFSDHNYNDHEIDPRLINEFDNLLIPEHMCNTDSSPTDTPEIRTKINSVPPLKQRPKTTPKTQKNSSCSFVRTPSPQRMKNLSSLKRSINIIDSVKPKNMKNKEDVQNYFQEQETKSPKIPVQQEIERVEVGTAEDLFSVDDAMYEEYKMYEQMYLKEKEEKIRLEQKKNAQIDDDNSLNLKMSGDSAYGSLSRNKPKVRTKVAKLSPLEPNRLESGASSSGSDTCIAQATVSSPPHIGRKGGGGGGCKMSKFCHECGNKYPVTSAKFCVECGVRRLSETSLQGNFVAKSLVRQIKFAGQKRNPRSLDAIDDNSEMGSI